VKIGIIWAKINLARHTIYLYIKDKVKKNEDRNIYPQDNWIARESIKRDLDLIVNC